VENPPNIPTIEQWITHLESLIREPLEQVPLDADESTKRSFIDQFQDEFGCRRATDGPLLGRVMGVSVSCETQPKDLDTRLWNSLANGEQDWPGLIKQDDGLVQSDAYAIEHRTLIELSALHALWHLNADQDGVLSERVDQLIDWHTRELQPDNGINRPWAAHAFIVRSIEATDEQTRLDAMLHAQTLVNNCCVTFGKPDILSAIILYDSTQSLKARL
jgi:hypothetical protein